MEFKSLEMNGFTSVDHIRITFSDGATAIVGREVAENAASVRGDMFCEGFLNAQANHVH